MPNIWIKALICLIILSMFPTTYALEIENINNATGGDITKNPLIIGYMPKTIVSDQVLNAAEYGTPMITLGNGEPKAFIVAGVHGNELPSQIAAIKLINNLFNKNIKGTVYIIPFLIPYSTAQNLRYFKGQNLNKVANIPGTPTNRIINLLKDKKIVCMGDFHSTKPGGYPGEKSVLCSKFPSYESYLIADFIKEQTGSKLICAENAGIEYPGALEDVSNLEGIPSVTCEVPSIHGTVTYKSISDSYQQMIAFLKFNQIL
jgi:uncharacterized protein